MEIKTKMTMLFVGHLEEVDDLNKWGRDAPFADTEANLIKLELLSKALITKINNSGRKAVMFLTSPKICPKQSARMLASEIKKKIEADIRFRYISIDALKPTYEGAFNLPSEYFPSTLYDGLKKALNIFSKEALEPSVRNFHYRFGDPILLSDGSYKYPEIRKYFSSYGETYSESLTRVFMSVISMSDKVHKLNSNVEVVLISHSFNYFILKGLSLLGKEIIEKGIQIKPGDIVEYLWNNYKTRRGELKEVLYTELDYSYLCNKSLIKLLWEEIYFMN